MKHSVGDDITIQQQSKFDKIQQSQEITVESKSDVATCCKVKRSAIISVNFKCLLKISTSFGILLSKHPPYFFSIFWLEIVFYFEHYEYY